ncbi:putative membrane protein [Hordeum vulgare]|nr:putative membrane protein [Hordeum vulgare]
MAVAAPGQLNLDEFPSWGSRGVDCFEKLEQIGEGTYRLGSARAVNCRYISDCVPARIRMQASTGFLSASALGMACGPALAGLLQWRFKIYMVTFSQSTLPGWLMAVAWLLYLVWLCISFKEPKCSTEVRLMRKWSATANPYNRGCDYITRCRDNDPSQDKPEPPPERLSS